MGNYNFEEDLKEGEQGEMIIALYLALCHGLKFKHYNKDYKYDIMMINRKTEDPVKFEVKSDAYVDYRNDTGNMAIEIRDRGKPSGISTSESDVFLYYFRNLQRDNVWMLKTDALKALIKENISSLKRVKGGDDNAAEMILIPRERFRRVFFVDTINKTDVQVQEEEGQEEHNS